MSGSEGQLERRAAEATRQQKYHTAYIHITNNLSARRFAHRIASHRSFWNFDTLFQPQSHPARDAHDTFFIKDPAETVSVPPEYYERVVKMHEEGGSGSIGYRYNFKEGDARKNLLRTHTTAVSSQMLYKLANQEGGFQPKRYFR